MIPAGVRADLAYLRRERYDLVALPELAARLRARYYRLGKTVAFAVDARYAAHRECGATDIGGIEIARPIGRPWTPDWPERKLSSCPSASGECPS